MMTTKKMIRLRIGEAARAHHRISMSLETGRKRFSFCSHPFMLARINSLLCLFHIDLNPFSEGENYHKKAMNFHRSPALMFPSKRNFKSLFLFSPFKLVLEIRRIWAKLNSTRSPCVDKFNDRNSSIH